MALVSCAHAWYDVHMPGIMCTCLAIRPRPTPLTRPRCPGPARQVFFLLKESELTPSGANLLDGRYAVFGYVTEGQDALGYMKVGGRAGAGCRAYDGGLLNHP
jgi:hypothetical protein